jgi:hypothetical protein
VITVEGLRGTKVNATVWLILSLVRYPLLVLVTAVRWVQQPVLGAGDHNIGVSAVWLAHSQACAMTCHGTAVASAALPEPPVTVP